MIAVAASRRLGYSRTRRMCPPAAPEAPQMKKTLATVTVCALIVLAAVAVNAPVFPFSSGVALAVSAALEHAFESGLQQVNWTCDADNPGSVRTDEQLGLERIEDYRPAVLIMDEKKHMAFFQQA